MGHVRVRQTLDDAADPQAHEVAVALVGRGAVDVARGGKVGLGGAPGAHHGVAVAVVAGGEHHALLGVEAHVVAVGVLGDHGGHAAGVVVVAAHQLAGAGVKEELGASVDGSLGEQVDGQREAAVEAGLHALGHHELLLVAELGEPLAVDRVVARLERPAGDLDAKAGRLEQVLVPPVVVGAGASGPSAHDELVGTVAGVLLHLEADLVDVLLGALQAVFLLEARVDGAAVLATGLPGVAGFDHDYAGALLGGGAGGGQAGDGLGYGDPLQVLGGTGGNAHGVLAHGGHVVYRGLVHCHGAVLS